MGNVTFGWAHSTTTVPKDYSCSATFTFANDTQNFVMDGTRTNFTSLYGQIEHQAGSNDHTTYWDDEAIRIS